MLNRFAQYKTQQMWDKAILENGGTLKSVADCYKNQEMCNKPVDNYHHAFEFFPECFMTQKMCDKAVNTYLSTAKFVAECYKDQEICNKAVHRSFFVFDFIPAWYKTQEMCDRVVSQDPFLIVYCPDKNPKNVWSCWWLAALKLIPNLFVTRKMIKELFTALYADDNLLYFSEDFFTVDFFCNEMGDPNIDLNDNNLDKNFDEDNPDTNILIRLLAWYIKFEKRKTIKK